jgi:hypothetical protein
VICWLYAIMRAMNLLESPMSLTKRDYKVVAEFIRQLQAHSPPVYIHFTPQQHSSHSRARLVLHEVAPHRRNMCATAEWSG